jgi:hypothetical protein
MTEKRESLIIRLKEPTGFPDSCAEFRSEVPDARQWFDPIRQTRLVVEYGKLRTRPSSRPNYLLRADFW